MLGAVFFVVLLMISICCFYRWTWGVAEFDFLVAHSIFCNTLLMLENLMMVNNNTTTHVCPFLLVWGRGMALVVPVSPLWRLLGGWLCEQIHLWVTLVYDFERAQLYIYI